MGQIVGGFAASHVLFPPNGVEAKAEIAACVMNVVPMVVSCILGDFTCMNPAKFVCAYGATSLAILSCSFRAPTRAWSRRSPVPIAIASWNGAAAASPTICTMSPTTGMLEMSAPIASMMLLSVNEGER